jgi:phenylacetate-CoA ligase
MSVVAKRLIQQTPLGPVLAIVRINGVQFVRHLLWLRRSQWWPASHLREFQARRIRQMVTHAYNESAYYREQFVSVGLPPEQVRGEEDLARLPLLTRADVRARFSDIRVRGAERFRPQVGATSGTTGASLEFLRDREATSVGNAALWRFWGWHGVRIGHRFAEIRSVFHREGGGPDPGTEVRYHPGSRWLHVSVIGHNPQRLTTAVEALERYRPDVIRCASPTLLAFLALHVLRQGKRTIRPRAVIAGGERLFPDQRQIIGEAFGVPVAEAYGNWEYAVFGGECERRRLHLSTEMGVVEILNGEGRRCAPLEIGQVVVTNLWNRSFPFIRYAIGDLAYMEGEPCPCGRGLPTWRIVGGREKDFLATPDGYLFLPNSLFAMDRWRGKIHGIRFYQETRHEVVVQVVRGPEFSDEDLSVLRAELDQWMAGRLKIFIEFCEHLDQTAGGKYRYVLSKVPIEL